MRIYIVTLLLFLVVVGGTTIAQEQQEYVNDNFSMSYPADWEQSEISGIPFFLSAQDGPKDSFRENINVVYQDLTNSPMTLEEFLDLSKQQIETMTAEHSFESIEHTTFAGLPAKELVYTMTQFNQKGEKLYLKLMQILCLRNNQAYVLTYTAAVNDFNSYLPAAKATFSSFEFVGE